MLLGFTFYSGGPKLVFGRAAIHFPDLGKLVVPFAGIKPSVRGLHKFRFGAGGCDPFGIGDGTRDDPFGIGTRLHGGLPASKGSLLVDPFRIDRKKAIEPTRWSAFCARNI
jgi:hypothetical protein